MKKLSIITAAVSAFALSCGAFAATQSDNMASGPGPRDAEEAGKPRWGGGNCSFIYSIQKIGPTAAVEDEEFTYHVFVRNLGNCKLRHIDLKDVLPEGVKFVSASPDPSHEHHGRLFWEDVSIPAGHYIDFQINVKADHHIHHPFYATNAACAYTPWIGTRICDSETTLLFPDHDDKPQEVSQKTQQ